MNKIQKAIKNQEEYVENYETESAPSGEWAEYNWEYLQEEGFLLGMQEISEIVGTCGSCKYFINEKPGICTKFNINKNKEGYCDEQLGKQNL